MYRSFIINSWAFIFVISSIFMVACDKEEEDVFKIQMSQLIGEWVYDHPERGVWEEQKYLESGVLYFSNINRIGFYFSNELVDGVYSIINNNEVEFFSKINNTSFYTKMTVFDITDYSYTAEYNNGESVGIFTYAKILNRYEMQRGEKIRPDYESLVHTKILGYRSHDKNIAVVNSQTGEITADLPGRTYVDVITEEGTAVVKVFVGVDWNSMLKNFGKNREGIIADNGLPYYVENALCYEVIDDPDVSSVMYVLQEETDVVNEVYVLLKGNVSLERMYNLLVEKYYYNSEITKIEELYYAFTDKETLDESSLGVILDGKNNFIYFLDLNSIRTRSGSTSFPDKIEIVKYSL